MTVPPILVCVLLLCGSVLPDIGSVPCAGEPATPPVPGARELPGESGEPEEAAGRGRTCLAGGR